MNVFLIASPLQFLNAVEAVQALRLSENHLVVLVGLGYANERRVYGQLIRPGDWASVRFGRIHNEAIPGQPRRSGSPLIRSFVQYRQLWRRYRNRRMIERFATSFRAVDAVVLGNYLDDAELYMRHFANRLEHRRLILIDDGTDVIRVNDKRRCGPSGAGGATATLSPWRRFKRRLRDALIEWDPTDAAHVTFFSAYQLDVKLGDELVRNDYRFLRAQTSTQVESDLVLFLGQSLIEDGYMERADYFDYMGRVQRYFAGRRLAYVPHPRESPATIGELQSRLGLVIERPELPIECHLARTPARPAVLASFFCSALHNCASIFGPSLSVKSFYIEPAHFLMLQAENDLVYTYFSQHATDRFEVVHV